MDAKLMVATDPGDVKKLKDVLNKEEDAVAMVVVTATSKKPSEEEKDPHPPPAGNINPLLLSSARRGSCGDLNVLLGMKATANPPMTMHAAHDVENQRAASLAAEALLRGVTPDGDTALHVVAGNGDDENFLKYAEIIYGRDRDLLFAGNRNGGTPLHCAALAGNYKMVSHLINLAGREGADMKRTFLRMANHRHETALHEAVRFEDGRILGPKERALLDAAPNLPREENNEDDKIVKLLMAVDPELANYPAGGISPLYLAISLEKSTVAMTLYNRSGGKLSYSGADGQNALHVSVLRDEVMVRFLLRWEKSLTAQVDRDGSTPLHFASSLFTSLHHRCSCRITRNPESTLNKIFQADPTILYQADKDGSFPIHVAASVGSRDAIQFFHEEYPDSAGLRDTKGRTFLHVAVQKRRVDIVSYVCRTSSLACILNVQDNDGNTALHLAIQARSFRMFCALIGNMKVNLNLSNSNGDTPRDISRSKLPRLMGYGQNSEIKIYRALQSVGANSGALRRDKIEIKYSRALKPGDEDKASEKLKDATQTFIVASVLIATVAFGATFAVPGGFRADDHTNGGTPTLAGIYAFDAFIMATTLAFICSSVSTVGFVFAATSLVSLSTRSINFHVSVFFMWSSVTCLSNAFALGVYMVLAPVARSTAVLVCVITPAILLSSNMEIIIKLFILAKPLCNRKGLWPALVLLVNMHMFTVASALWPFIATFGWAALARIHR